MNVKISKCTSITLITLLTLNSFAQNSIPVVKSNTEDVHYKIENVRNTWGISPETNPDRLQVYCGDGMVNVTFTSDIDTIKLKVKNNDTSRFYFLLKGKDRILTEVIGVKDIPDKISDNDKVYFLSLLWSEIKYNFINIDQFRYSLDSIYRAFIPRVLATTDDYEYYQELKRFAALYNDGHTEVISNNQFGIYRDYLNVLFSEFDRHIYITVINKKAKETDSTYIGAELTEVNGMPVEDYLEKNIFPFVSASTEQSKRMTGLYNLHSGLKSEKFNCKVRKTDGKVVSLSLPYNGSELRSDDEEYWGVTPKYLSSMVEMQWLKDSVACVSINSFYPEEAIISEFNKQLPALYKARGIIIDLRKNGGGSTGTAWHIQSFLTKEKYFLNFGSQTRVNDGVKKANGNWIEEYKPFYEDRAISYDPPDTIKVSDTIRRFSVPVVILIGRYTFSAAEDLLVNLYEVPGRPLFVGQATGGSTGSPLVISGLPGDGYARICTRRICFPYSGKPFVNKGIIPDITVPVTLEDYMSGRDATLEKAVELIR